MDAPDSPPPGELSRWNWGAFLLGWVWALGNKTYVGLISLIPLANIPFAFVLGWKGSAWAWRNKRWHSIEHFRRVQRAWALWGVIIQGSSLLAGAFLGLFPNAGIEIPILIVAFAIAVWFAFVAGQASRNVTLWALAGFGVAFASGMVFGTLLLLLTHTLETRIPRVFLVPGVLLAAFPIVASWICLPLILGRKWLRPRAANV